jgi:DNA-binding response OmpR family regulator
MARILVIDDDPDIRALLKELLKPAGHEVVLAADRREGAMQHSTGPADLVITDLYMPHQDGLKAIQELRSCFPEVAIIAMSGRTDTGATLSIAQQVSAIGILQKPFLVAELLAAVAKTLGRQSPAK